MKVYLVGLVLMLLMSVFVQAEQVPMINKAGEVSLIKLVEQPDLPRLLNEAEQEAFDHPGQEIPINFTSYASKKIDFWHRVSVQKYSEVIIFEGGQIKTISKDGMVNGQPLFCSYIIFCFMAIGLMLASNAYMKENKNDIAFAALAALAATLAAALAALAAAALAFAFAALAALAALAAATVKGRVKFNLIIYTFFSIVFYILIALVIFL